jgi:hypothetical protein
VSRQDGWRLHAKARCRCTMQGLEIVRSTQPSSRYCRQQLRRAILSRRQQRHTTSWEVFTLARHDCLKESWTAAGYAQLHAWNQDSVHAAQSSGFPRSWRQRSQTWTIRLQRQTRRQPR